MMPGTEIAASGANADWENLMEHNCLPDRAATTTLFDLVAAVQDSLSADEAAHGLVVPVVQDLLCRVARRPLEMEEYSHHARVRLSAQDAAA
jgi:hypothetical protein